MPEACPKCGHENIIKHGFILQKQRYKCKSCNYQYAYGTAQPITTTNRERGKPKWMKVMTILLYVSGLSMNAIAQLFNVSAQAVLNWVRDYAKTHCKKPEPGSAVIVELDEFWHFIESKKKSYGYGKLMNACGTQAIVIEVDSLTGNWEVVNGYATLRYRQTLRKLLDRLAQWQVTVYCTDHWEAYASELEEHPEAHHVETKTETRNIERNNSDHRHWFARFRRKSKVVSKSKEMVELTLALFAKLRVNETINSMRDSMLALLT